MKSRIVLYILALTFAAGSFPFSFTLAQDQKPFNLGVSIGINDFHAKDEHINSLTYSGINFSPSFNFSYRGGMCIHALKGSYSGGAIESKYGHEDVNNFTGSLSYNYLHLIGSYSLFNKPVKFYAGAGLSVHGWNSDFTIGTRFITSTFETYYVRYSLDAVFGCEYELSGASLAYMNISLPVWSYIGRPIYIFDETLGAFEKPFHQKPSLIWDDFAITAELGYRAPLSEYFLFDFNYQFQYASSEIPLPVNMFGNSFKAGFIWHF